MRPLPISNRRVLAALPRWLSPIPLVGARYSVRAKIMRVVVLTSLAALLLSGTATLLRDLSRYEQSQATELSTEADILALATAPALAFDDRPTAQHTLTAVQARPAVLIAALYDPQGRLFAEYVRNGQSASKLLRAGASSGVSFSGDHIELIRRVTEHNEWLGTLYLQAHYDVWGSVRDYAGILGLVTAVSLLAALVLSTMLQRALTAPLVTMATVARQVVEGRDFSLRAPQTTEDEVGVVVQAFNSMLDEVQARARAVELSNAALRESEARFRATFDIAAVGVANVSTEGRFLLVNDRLCFILGYSRQELLGLTFSEITHPDDLEADWTHARDLLAGKALNYSMEKRYFRKDGTALWADLTVSLVRNEVGAPLYFISVIEDIGQRKASEEALIERERRFVALADAMPQLVWVSDPDGVTQYLNRRWYSDTSYAENSNNWLELIHPDERERAQQRWAQSVQTGDPYEDEFRLRVKDGSHRWFLTRAMADRDPQTGSILRWFGTCTDVDRPKSIEEKLRAGEAALREADRRKDVFIATLAHELRNPLAPLRVAARLLGSPQLRPDQLESTRAIIGRQVQHMALLLDDLLDASRITRGVLELKKDFIDVADSIDAALETVRPLIESKQHHLIVSKASQPMILEADPVRLTQIITNLVANAAKYTDPGGEITLSASAEAETITVSVRDSGIGLAPQSLPRLFEMFSQLQPSGSRAEGGLGIGLALVKGLVDLHGGRIEVHSDGLGRGSEFRVQFRRAPGAFTANDRLDDAAIPGARPRRILIADDNRDAAESLALFLRFAGHDIHVAYSGLAALERASQLRPEILILDIGMPEMNGYEVARSVRQQPWATAATLIAVTGWGQLEDRQQALAAGFDFHMTKPIDPVRIQVLLQRVDRKRTSDD